MNVNWFTEGLNTIKYYDLEKKIILKSTFWDFVNFLKFSVDVEF